MPDNIEEIIMKQSEIKKLTDYWKTASEKDMDAAREIFKKTAKYVTVLFYIHLSIEKIIKAFYVYNKKEHAPYSHNLLFLSKSSDLDISEKDKKLLSEINEFNIECRYPDEKFNIYQKASRSFTEKYLKKAEKFREWILGKFDS